MMVLNMVSVNLCLSKVTDLPGDTIEQPLPSALFLDFSITQHGRNDFDHPSLAVKS